ncbi:MAG: hypothetical protein WCA46_04080 [Actinocatenispora sp.]
MVTVGPRLAHSVKHLGIDGNRVFECGVCPGMDNESPAHPSSRHTVDGLGGRTGLSTVNGRRAALASGRLRVVVLAAVGAGLLALSTACDLGGSADGAQSSGNGTPSSRSSASASPTVSPSGDSGSAASDPCPVDAATLLAALKESDIYGRSGDPDDLKDVECYRGYAVAGAVRRDNDPEYQAPGILFGYSEPDSAWRALNLGSLGYCDGYVPADVAAHFKDTSCPST